MIKVIIFNANNRTSTIKRRVFFFSNLDSYEETDDELDEKIAQNR